METDNYHNAKNRLPMVIEKFDIGQNGGFYHAHSVFIIKILFHDSCDLYFYANYALKCCT